MSLVTANASAPNQVTATPATPATPFEQSSDLLSGSADMFKNIAGGGILQNINDYINPYYEQVVNSTVGQMERNLDRGLLGVGDQAQAAGAFGGSRHGLVESDLMAQTNRNIGDVTGNLMMQGYNQASNALRSDMFNAARGMQGLGGQYYQIGNDLTDRQAGMGQGQQDFFNQILQGVGGSYQNMMQSPYQMIDLFSAILGQDPRRGSGTTTGSSKPGLFDYLALAAGMGSAALGNPSLF